MVNNMAEKRDFTHLEWSLSRASSGTAGSFLKAYEEKEGKKYYYKLSNFDSVRGVFGHECFNEIIAQNIADVLNMPHLTYKLFNADVIIDNRRYETWLTRTEDFKLAGEHKLTFETYFEMHRVENETVWRFIERNGFQTYFEEMLLLDFIICNRDRHGANIEVLVKDGQYRLAPLFDHGLSLLFSCYNDAEAMKSFDRLKMSPANNYIGGISLEDNLSLVSDQLIRNALTIRWSKEQLFKDLQDAYDAVIPEYWIYVEKMIRERTDCLAEIFDKRRNQGDIRKEYGVRSPFL